MFMMGKPFSIMWLRISVILDVSSCNPILTLYSVWILSMALFNDRIRSRSDSACESADSTFVFLGFFILFAVNDINQRMLNLFNEVLFHNPLMK